MSHHLHLLRCVPSLIELTEDIRYLTVEPLPRRVSPRTSMHAGELKRHDFDVANRARVQQARAARAGRA